MKKLSGGRHKDSPSATAVAIEELLYEIAPTYREVVSLGNRLGTRSAKGGYIVFLEILADGGPQTVPELARKRSVTRQHVQTVVNDLITQGILEKVDNPDHKRSKLIQLSPKGHEALDSTVGRLQRWYEAKRGHFTLTELRTAKRVLRKLQEEIRL